MSIRLVRSVRFAQALRAIFAVTAITLAATAVAQEPAVPNPSHSTKITPAAVNYDARPLVFEANRGQADASVRFVAHGRGYSLLLTDSEAVLALRKGGDCRPQMNRPGAKPLACAAASAKTDVVRMKLAASSDAGGAGNAGFAPAGEVELPSKVNYFIGSDPARWRAGVPTYAKVRYNGVYPGVDLVFYGNQRQLEYDFVVAPEADPSRIALALTGAKSTRIDAASGDLLIAADQGELRLLRPATYQLDHGKRVAIRSSFKLIAENKIGFAVGAHDHRLPLVIDPMLTYSTYLGGSGNDSGNAIAVDASGSAYVTGSTDSADFPTLDPLQSKNGNATKGTAFVTKFTPDGSGLVYSTYLGGSGGDSGAGIAVDADGNAYITGTTSSIDFPMVNALQTTNNGAANGNSTVFVAKINPAGSALVFSTYLGGSGNDTAAGIAVDRSQGVYVTGTTGSVDFPLQNPVQATNNNPGIPDNGNGNAFVTKITAAGSALVYSTYLGGSGDANSYQQAYPYGPDTASGIAVDANGEAIVVGTTNSMNFPVSDAFQPQNNSIDLGEGPFTNGSQGFVTKYKADGSGYIFSTYFGGPGLQASCESFEGVWGDTINAVALDTGGDIYVTGATRGGIATKNPIQPFLGFAYPPFGIPGAISNTNAFVSEFTANGSDLLFSTPLGGTGNETCGVYQWIIGGCGHEPYCGIEVNGGDAGTGITVDPAGSIYIAGTTQSPDFPVVNPVGNAISGIYFIAKLHSGGPIVYSSYFGSSVSGLVVDSRRNAYLTGTTAGLPTTPGAFQTSPGGGNDAYVARITIKGTPQGIAINPPELTFGVPKNLTGRAFATSGLPVQYAVRSSLADFNYTTATMNGNVLTPNGAGLVTIEAYQPGNGTYEGAAAHVTVYAKPEALIVAAMNASMTYGGAVPTLGYYPVSITVNDGLGVLTGTPGLSTTATSRSPVGIYPITPSLGTLAVFVNNMAGPLPYGDPNYAFAFKNATLAVKRAELTVTANSSTIHQGQRIEPELTYSFTGFRNGDKASVVKGKPILSTRARLNAPPGRYELVVKQGTLTAKNYKFKEVDGWITIVK